MVNDCGAAAVKAPSVECVGASKLTSRLGQWSTFHSRRQTHGQTAARAFYAQKPPEDDCRCERYHDRDGKFDIEFGNQSRKKGRAHERRDEQQYENDPIQSDASSDVLPNGHDERVYRLRRK
jgi:hypothetical protein